MVKLGYHVLATSKSVRNQWNLTLGDMVKVSCPAQKGMPAKQFEGVVADKKHSKIKGISFDYGNYGSQRISGTYKGCTFTKISKNIAEQLKPFKTCWTKNKQPVACKANPKKKK